MRFGLALCAQALQNSIEDDKLFFTAMNQINEAGLSALHDISQKHVIAELNLKAGRRATDLSDYNTALKLFQYGISFLGVIAGWLTTNSVLSCNEEVMSPYSSTKYVSKITYFIEGDVIHSGVGVSDSDKVLNHNPG
jgi:hypothetical protein